MIFHVVLGVLTVYFLVTWWRKKRNLPPGPWCLPVLGYLPWFDQKSPYKTLHDLSKKYGPIYGLHMGNIYTVVVSDVKLMKKMLFKDSTTGRAPLYLTHGLMKNHGLICAEGDRWKDQRKFVYSCLRQFGGTKIGPQRLVLEKKIMKNSKEFIDYVESVGSSSFSPLEHLRHSLGSFLNEIVFGEVWEKDDETWKYLQHLQEEGIKYIGIAGPLNFIPILRFLPMYSRIVEFLTKGLQNTHEIYDEIIDKHEKILNEVLQSNPDYEPVNFLEAFLMEKERKKNNPEHVFYDRVQLRYLLADLFGAGLDTTLTTMNWYILLMSLHKDIQKKIREELHSVLQNKHPTMNDFQYLPFFEASIAEVQRFRSTVPIGIPHGTTDEVNIEGYVIPRNSMIIPLQWAVHTDEKNWENPESFQPSRFLDEDGRFNRPETLIPFQIGKRICVGEELAKMLLYLFCSSILQKFEILVENPEEVSLDGNCGITLTPNDYKISFRKV